MVKSHSSYQIERNQSNCCPDYLDVEDMLSPSSDRQKENHDSQTNPFIPAFDGLKRCQSSDSLENRPIQQKRWQNTPETEKGERLGFDENDEQKVPIRIFDSEDRPKENHLDGFTSKDHLLQKASNRVCLIRQSLNFQSRTQIICTKMLGIHFTHNYKQKLDTILKKHRNKLTLQILRENIQEKKIEVNKKYRLSNKDIGNPDPFLDKYKEKFNLDERAFIEFFIPNLMNHVYLIKALNDQKVKKILYRNHLNFDEIPQHTEETVKLYGVFDKVFDESINKLPEELRNLKAEQFLLKRKIIEFYFVSKKKKVDP